MKKRYTEERIIGFLREANPFGSTTGSPEDIRLDARA